jgi:hypothetical protein
MLLGRSHRGREARSLFTDQTGVGHGQYKPSDLDIAEAEFILYTYTSAILFLGKKFDLKEEKLIDEDDIPF